MTDTSDAIARLQKLLGDKGFIADAAGMEPFLREERGTYHGAAKAVLRPASTEEVSACVKICAEAKMPIFPQAGNTGLAGGAVPWEDGKGVVLSVSRMNRVRALDPIDYSITVEAGVILADVQKAAEGVDRLFPLSLGAEGSCQIGGNISTNAGGIQVLRYGNTRALVLGLEVVLPDGRVWHGLRALRKDNTGYDMKQLFIGAEGTLGIVTAATLRLFPAPKSVETAFLGLTRVEDAMELFSRARKASGDQLTAFELISRFGIDMALKHGNGIIDPLPTIFPWYVLLEVSSSEAQSGLLDTLEQFLSDSMEAGLIRDGVIAKSGAQARDLWRIREGLVEAQKYEGASVKHDISVPVSKVANFITSAHAAIEEWMPGIRPNAFGHVGDGNIHYNIHQPVAAEKTAFLARQPELNRIVHDIAVGLNGSISAEHGIGRLKVGELAHYKEPLEIEMMRRVKQALDPGGIMNPGENSRIVSGYVAPLTEIRFALDAIANLSEIATLPGFDAAASNETVDAILDEAAKFAGEVLAPLNVIGDRERSRLENGTVRTPPGFKAAYDAFVAGGWNALAMPEAHGGQGLPLALSVAVLEMWTSANLAFSLCPILTQAAIELLATYGSDAQRRLYLAKLMSGEWTGTMNLTEPQAGSDLGAVRMRAVKDGDHYRLTGQKIFITYGEHDLAPNIVHAVLARTPDAAPGSKGLSLFIVPKFLVDADGRLGTRNDIRCLKLEEKLGIHASPTCVLSYGDDGGAIGTLIGEEGRGLEYMFLMMNGARLNVGLQGVAIAERAYQQARDYARSCVQGRAVATKDANAPIIHHPDVRRMLLSMRSDTDAARALLYYTAGQIDRARREPDSAKRARYQTRVDLLIPIAKAWSTARGFEVASTNIQIHGGMGFIEETGAAQHLRDARIALIYEGTNGIQANDLLTRKLARDDGATMRDFVAEMRALDLTRLEELEPLLRDGIDALEKASESLCSAYRARPAIALAGAMPFLELFGTVTAGWLMTKAAIAASRERDAEFAKAKRITTKFFAEQRLATATALLPAIAGGATVMQLDIDRI